MPQQPPHDRRLEMDHGQFEWLGEGCSVCSRAPWTRAPSFRPATILVPFPHRSTRAPVASIAAITCAFLCGCKLSHTTTSPGFNAGERTISWLKGLRRLRIIRGEVHGSYGLRCFMLSSIRRNRAINQLLA
jgi:hypothetical protein